jgi:hypothetical protein
MVQLRTKLSKFWGDEDQSGWSQTTSLYEPPLSRSILVRVKKPAIQPLEKFYYAPSLA